MYVLDLNFSNQEYEFWLYDLFYGSHTFELRKAGSGLVTFIGLISYGLASFYIIQTLIYLWIGPALEGKNTGVLRFFKYVIIGLRDCANESWTSGTSDSNLSNIENILKYRDNKMAFMSNKDAAEFMRGTGHIDMMLSRPDLEQSRKTLSYLNNKIAFMSNESALNFIKGK